MGGRINKISGFYSAELEEVNEDTVSRIVKEERSEILDDMGGLRDTRQEQPRNDIQ